MSRLRTRARGVAARVLRARPNFLIIGTQKGGTTSLHAYLSEHPGIMSALGPKELHFFNLYYHRGIASYLVQFPYRFRTGGRLCFEATPDYLYHAVVPARIRRHLGRPKLIAVLREPAERAYSAWRMWHSFANRPDKAAKADRRSFSRAVDEELASPDGQCDRHFHYVAMGRYADQIAAYRTYFPAEDLLILDHAEMARDLHGFLNQICRFLGLKPFDRAATERFGYRRYWVGPERPPTAEDAATLARLRCYYAPHNERLFSLLGRRLAWDNASWP